MLRRLIQIARDERLARVYGELIRDNFAMQKLLREFGFQCRLLKDPGIYSSDAGFVGFLAPICICFRSKEVPLKPASSAFHFGTSGCQSIPIRNFVLLVSSEPCPMGGKVSCVILITWVRDTDHRPQPSNLRLLRWRGGLCRIPKPRFLRR
jgi:hypothetical protein